MKKTSNSNAKKNKSKDCKSQIYEDRLDTITLQMAPANADAKKRFFLGLMMYVTDHDTCLELEEYYDFKGVSPETAQRWAREDDIYKEAVEKAKRIIGRRRQEIGRKNNLTINHSVIYPLLNYSPTWRLAKEEHARLASLGEDKNQGAKLITQVVEIPVYKDSGKVPDKKDL